MRYFAKYHVNEYCGECKRPTKGKIQIIPLLAGTKLEAVEEIESKKKLIEFDELYLFECNIICEIGKQ